MSDHPIVQKILSLLTHSINSEEAIVGSQISDLGGDVVRSQAGDDGVTIMSDHPIVQKILSLLTHSINSEEAIVRSQISDLGGDVVGFQAGDDGVTIMSDHPIVQKILSLLTHSIKSEETIVGSQISDLGGDVVGSQAGDDGDHLVFVGSENSDDVPVGSPPVDDLGDHDHTGSPMNISSPGSVVGTCSDVARSPDAASPMNTASPASDVGQTYSDVASATHLDAGSDGMIGSPEAAAEPDDVPDEARNPVEPENHDLPGEADIPVGAVYHADDHTAMTTGLIAAHNEEMAKVVLVGQVKVLDGFWFRLYDDGPNFIICMSDWPVADGICVEVKGDVHSVEGLLCLTVVTSIRLVPTELMLLHRLRALYEKLGDAIALDGAGFTSGLEISIGSLNSLRKRLSSVMKTFTRERGLEEEG